jgi:YidC/Oxa1 family membrane protein insertase
MVAQLPVFISLFYMLRKNLRHDICPNVQLRFQEHYAAVHHIAATSSQALSQTTWCTYYHAHYPGAGFLFINDITNTASGVTLVVLLALYVGTQVMSTLLMSAPTMDKNQRRMMLFLPLVFVLFIIRFPAGLIVYWITTNAWTMAQQYTIKRLMGPVPPAAALEGDGDAGNGDSGGSSGGGIGSLFRGRGPRGGGGGNGGSSSAAVAPARAAVTPPRPPRKKKKRSGRRR